jgi:O-antigen/teichoic acid export membrane protein
MSGEHQYDRALVSGLAWTACARWGAQVISWIATLYAARLLQPSDYGIVAMAMIAIGVARMVEDFGLDAILIQDRSIQGEQRAQLAGFILGFAVLLSLIFLLLAVPVANFFHEPQVAWAIAGLSVLFITDALQVVPRAMLQRDLAYSRLAVLAIVQTVATQAVLVEGAHRGWGFWALVLNSLAGALAATLLLIWWRPYAIHWPRNPRSIARVLLQGWRQLVSRGAYYFYTRADQTIIGRVLGKDALGAYSFAQTLSTTTIQEVSSVVTQVVPGVFSATQDRRDALRRYFLILTEFVSYLTMPMAIGLALTADLVVPVALGPGWEAVIEPLRLLCLFTVFQNAQLLISHLMVYTGQFRAFMWCTILSSVFVPLGFLGGVRYGLEGIAIVMVVIYPLTNIPSLIIGFRTIGIRTRDWLGTQVPAAVSCAFMSLAVLAARPVVADDHSVPVQCALLIATGMAVYGATMLLLFRQRLAQMIGVVLDLRRKAPSAPPQVAPAPVD